MRDDVVVSIELDELRGYVEELGKIIQQVAAAALAAESAQSLANDAGTYQGKAKEELSVFYTSMNIHISRLITFYTKSLQYMMNMPSQIQNLDEQISKLIESGVLK